MKKQWQKFIGGLKMTLFKFLYTMESVFSFSKKQLIIRFNDYWFIDKVPCNLMKKEVINFTICNDVIKIYVK